MIFQSVIYIRILIMDIGELKGLINSSADGYKLKIKVSANSKKNSLEFLDDADSLLKIKVNKPAVDGKANKAIIEYLSDVLNIPKSNIIILNGEKSSQKCLLIKAKKNII